jgi:hypothetical protein
MIAEDTPAERIQKTVLAGGKLGPDDLRRIILKARSP